MATQVSSLKEKYEKLLGQLNMLLSPLGLEFEDEYVSHIDSVLSVRFDEYTASIAMVQQLELRHAQIRTEVEKTGESLSEKLSILLKRETELKQEEKKL